MRVGIGRWTAGFRKDPNITFWRWFDKHQDRLLDFESDQERTFDELSRALSRVNPELTFEFGPKAERREFVISAGGIRSAFPAVTSLVASAPQLDRWRITAFRPRRTPINIVEIGQTRVDPADVEFSLLSNGTMIGIHLFIPGFKEDSTPHKQIGYLMLDEALGEYDVETKVGLIKMLPSEPASIYRRYPIADLPALFDQLETELKGSPAPN